MDIHVSVMMTLAFVTASSGLLETLTLPPFKHDTAMSAEEGAYPFGDAIFKCIPRRGQVTIKDRNTLFISPTHATVLPLKSSIVTSVDVVVDSWIVSKSARI
jgi:hypothetical protein